MESTSLRTLLPHPDTPWLLNSNLFQRLQSQKTEHTYKKCEITSGDPEWNFILQLFNVQKPDNRSIAHAYCIHNAAHTQQFEGYLHSQEQQAEKSTFTPKWKQEDQAQLRETTINRWKQLTAPFSPFILPNKRQDKCSSTKIVPLWHGTQATTCDSICSTGFATFGKHEIIQGTAGYTQNTDIGFFGSGIYFTTSAQYAATVYSKKDSALLLAWVSMREPYPVIADVEYKLKKPADMEKLEGLGAYQNYNAHYIPVVPFSATIYVPCTEDQTPTLDEIVVFNPAQTLVRFWIELQVDLLKEPNLITSEHLLECLLTLLNNASVKQNHSLYQCLEQKKQTLMTLNPFAPLTIEDQEFYKWITQLLDTSGKFHAFALKKFENQMLWTAAKTADLNLLKKYVKSWWFYEVEEKINAKDSNDCTPLLLAVQQGHFEIVQYLLSHKANPLLIDTLNYSPLHWAAKKGYTAIAAALLQAGAIVNAGGEYGRTPLHMAAHNGHVEIVSLLLQAKAGINDQTAPEDSRTTPLHEAILREHLDVVKVLCERQRLNVNICDTKNCSPLYYAVQLGLTEAVALLIAHPSWKCPEDPQNPNHPSQLQKLTPLRNAENIKKQLEQLQ